MHKIAPETEPGQFEVILSFEGQAWLFSTYAQGSVMREALERAEQAFFVHALHHELGNGRFKATSACLIHERYDHYFTKRDGKWQLAQSPAGDVPAPS